MHVGSWMSQKYFHVCCLKKKKKEYRASLVTQWWRIRLPVQETWKWSLIWEDPTCHRATKPVCHNYWVCGLEPESRNYWAHLLQLLKPVRLEPRLPNERSHRSARPVHNRRAAPLTAAGDKPASKADPAQPKINRCLKVHIHTCSIQYLVGCEYIYTHTHTYVLYIIYIYKLWIYW